MTALPYTPTRLDLAEDIKNELVRHWHFTVVETRLLNPDRKVTADVATFVRAGLATYGQPENGLQTSTVRLTPAGALWLEAATSGAGPGSTSPEPGPEGGAR